MPLCFEKFTFWRCFMIEWLPGKCSNPDSTLGRPKPAAQHFLWQFFFQFLQRHSPQTGRRGVSWVAEFQQYKTIKLSGNFFHFQLNALNGREWSPLEKSMDPKSLLFYLQFQMSFFAFNHFWVSNIFNLCSHRANIWQGNQMSDIFGHTWLSGYLYWHEGCQMEPM